LGSCDVEACADSEELHGAGRGSNRRGVDAWGIDENAAFVEVEAIGTEHESSGASDKQRGAAVLSAPGEGVVVEADADAVGEAFAKVGGAFIFTRGADPSSATEEAQLAPGLGARGEGTFLGGTREGDREEKHRGFAWVHGDGQHTVSEHELDWVVQPSRVILPS
jgi:hypothetical protein